LIGCKVISLVKIMT